MANDNTAKKPSVPDSEYPGRFDFVGKGTYCTILSIVLTVGSLILIFTKGLNFGIDFAGGTEVQVQFEKEVPTGTLREALEKAGIQGASVQSLDGEKEFLIRMATVELKTAKETNQAIQSNVQKLTDGLTQEFASAGVEIRRVDTVGPQVGRELIRNSVLALFYSLLAILIYIALRFDYKYAPGAVFCLFHDAIITVGIFSIINHEVSIQTLAAVLTIVGYSINDTIVTFDRIRENEPLFRGKPIEWVINRAVNDTLSRTILTSLTTMLAVAALYLLAGGVISDFALTLGIGMIIGVYSTIYVASPLVVFVDRLQQRRAAA